MSGGCVAIIGAGPTGLAAAQAALDAGFLVDLIDALNSPVPEDFKVSVKSSSSGSLAKKTKFNSSSMYEYPDELIHYADSLDLPISNSVGGLTSVWGANVWFPEPSEIGLKESDKTAYLKAQSEISRDLKTMGSQKIASYFGLKVTGPVPQTLRTGFFEAKSTLVDDSTYLGSSFLAVDADACVECGRCLTGCPENAIFNAEDGWKELIIQNKVKHIDGIALTIESDNSIIIQNSNGVQRLAKNYDRIYVACGAIASASLLQRSSLIPKEVFLNDTQVFYLPFFSLRKQTDEQTRFTLAQLFYRSAEIENGIHMSIYESSPDLKHRAKNKHPILATLVPNFIWKRVLAGIGFVSANSSGRIKIVLKNNISEVSTIENQNIRDKVKSIYFKEIRGFKGTGLIPISLGLTIPNVGASYHVGSLQNFLGDRLFNSCGEVSKERGIYVVDSSSFQKIPLGPITVAAMVNARRIVFTSLEKVC
jgi:ferredoxin